MAHSRTKFSGATVLTQRGHVRAAARSTPARSTRENLAGVDDHAIGTAADLGADAVSSWSGIKPSDVGDNQELVSPFPRQV
ncbi:hypothetical protein LWC34_00650 [Kibdelosporangium philippinense]|uniref:Uncharacterized protein n=1 Tax=Kibdelosporangium philippinense TaxID=211113 RepID=A0ABS8Z045_9PSEU|nr:hypothetical protein [Kibdelosporangium philippinense]MCE7001356.1 hypothetical protein [Kibdelosporangium philippinense]